MSNILSIQSAVAFGHVGNSAAVFPLQRIGHEVWPVYTVNYSNHTGYGAWEGPIIPAADVAAVLRGIRDRDAFPLIDAALTGYQASPEIGDVIVDAVTEIKAANPDALYACDPVMGSATSGCFVPDAVPPMFREKVVPAADIITPNQFELGYLTERDVTDLDSTLAAVDAAREIGPSTVLVTSVNRPETPEDAIEMIAVDDNGKWIVRTPRIPAKRNGSGDVTAALFTGHYLRGRDAKDALAKTASSVYDLLRVTYEADATELKLVEAQDFYAEPRMQFSVEAL
ncbi:pyridoxal kinase PdxY [Corynebacterium lujinxingii]|uniref:pyridoxal kinase n=1 Tax=Corynebacterium lujinxingii TaxID=2763010 RepID=A0A7H0JXJ4_9CORY|nr:pyridoxal kinase PdxY [Corynebacterium lujinxingii]MBC3177799.1 pyridoxal kinase PdxY [Corynebacterium lujinxingii]NNO09956.1 pyridoxal kinase PdxY [Corynebacterium lujinxingii]QNP89760.1 pyridoxal kinase PdxY [Corynebacterium lujinxingii]